MHTRSLASLITGLRAKEFSALELTEHFIQRIKQLDSQTNAFISVNEEGAIEQAKKLTILDPDQALAGIPIAHKDIFCTKGLKTSCGSKMLDNFVSPYDASVVEKLKTAGAICIGKTNMDEFAMGSSNETSYYGPTKNPWNLAHVPGGSSGGSAAAVAARLAPATTGTDTGGSIRQPAAFCGVTGLKPTYGLVSRWGMIAFASSLDQAGPMALSAEDAAILLTAMAGHDERDSTSYPHTPINYTEACKSNRKSLKVGIVKSLLSDDLDKSIQLCFEETRKSFSGLDVTFEQVELPNSHLSIPAYYVIAPAECSSNLSRFDGVRYGHRCDSPENLMDLYERSRSEGFGAEVKRRIMMGTYALSTGYYDAYYRKAQKIRRIIKDDYDRAFKSVDMILTPTTPTPAFKLGEKITDPVSMYLNDLYTIPANLAGLPAINFPAGFSKDLPIGMQLVGPAFSEATLLNTVYHFQQETDWHKQIPKAFQ